MSHTFMDLITKKAPQLPKGIKWLNTEKSISLNDFKGYIVILDFWNYACKDCENNDQILSEIEKKYSDRPIISLSIHSTESKESGIAKKAQAAAKRLGIKRPIALDLGQKIYSSYFVSSLPSLIVIGSNGKMAFNLDGQFSLEQLIPLIDTSIQKGIQAKTLAGS